MERGFLGFSKKEVTWFALFFIFSLSLITFSAIRLIHKYYSHGVSSSSTIKKASNDLLHLQDIDHFSVNIQRSSLNLIIYSDNPKELDLVTANVLKNRDSLSGKLMKLTTDSLLHDSVRLQINAAGRAYLAVNETFLKLIKDSLKQELPETYNVNVMRPALRKFTDLIRQTAKNINMHIHQTTETRVNIFHQFELWILIAMLLPYIYFFFRFLALIVRMILWDLKG